MPVEKIMVQRNRSIMGHLFRSFAMKYFALAVFVFYWFLGGIPCHSQDDLIFAEKNKLIIRESPGGNALGVIKDDQPVTIIEEQGDWCKVTLTGWIYKPAIRANSVKTESAMATEKTTIDKRFTFKKVEFKQGDIGTECSGTVTNNSEDNYKVTTFEIQIYDAKGRLLETKYFEVTKLRRHTIRSFNASLVFTKLDKVADYSIRFENGY